MRKERSPRSGGRGESERAHAAFAPEDYRRLAELKARLDPGVLFHCNHAILPAR